MSVYFLAGYCNVGHVNILILDTHICVLFWIVQVRNKSAQAGCSPAGERSGMKGMELFLSKQCYLNIFRGRMKTIFSPLRNGY
ncbi:hypothetical protein DMA11_17710 [Marinilabiliaceae bacterium JC017]|nr:hypothetical protein DMA11_17710 [Marinilabiliaceae bacterium JC017]